MKDLYFIDETTKTIFALVELQGKVQMNLLGIQRIHYINSDISKNWYEETKNKIMNSKHPKLMELYILLNTKRGTVPLHRDLGIDNRMVDRPITVIKNSIFNDLQIQVSKYIKGLTLNNVECKATENGLEIECEVEIDERI